MKAKNVVKKIICIALVLIMLAGNLINPIVSIAKEIENATNNDSSYSENNEANVDNNSEAMEENNKDDGATEERETTEADRNEKQEESVIPDNGKEEETKADGTAKTEEIVLNNLEDIQVDTQNENQIEEDSLNGDDVLILNNSLSVTNDISKLKKGQSAKAISTKSQTSSTKSNEDELKDRLQPLTKDNIEINTKNDEHEIRVFDLEFLYGAQLDSNNNLVWTPSNSSEGHEFAFRINYSLSGEKELPPEAVKITIPKSIIRNRNKNHDDKFIMSLPTSDEWEGTSEFAYIENKDYLVIYNPGEVPAGLNGYIEIAYSTKSKTFSYKDYDIANTELVKDGGTASDPFYATIAVQSGEDLLTNATEEKSIFINTTVQIQSTQKLYPTLHREWDSSWMQQIPADSNDYYYLVWPIRTNIGDATQPYNFRIEDFVTDLTEGTTGEGYELVGYKLSGENYYSNNNTKANQTITGIRYDSVLTRHKKSIYSLTKYELKNTETAIVDPIDQVDEDTNATSSNIFYWDPAFVPPTGHFELFKFGNNSGFNGNYSSYNLEKLQNNEVNELENFKYKTETIGYAYPWTIRDGGSSSNPEDYGYYNVNYETWDDTLNLEEDERPVDYNDYYLESFIYTIDNNDVEYDDFNLKFNTTSPIYQDDEEIVFYGKFNGGEDWIQIGTNKLKTKQLIPNTDYVQEMTTSKITFKPGVHATGWRFTTSNKHYYTNIKVVPHYVLTNSDYVSEKIAGKDVIRLQNKVNTEVTDHNNEKIFERERIAIDYARVTYYESEISKRVSSVSNNVVKRNYNITWRVNAWEKITGGTGITEYLIQDSGKFYDLIPEGGVVDVSSLQVLTEAGYLPDNEYTYDIISNFKNSGRTMLIIDINTQAQYYTVYYKTVHSWDRIKDYGKNVLNPVAYETGNEKIAKGHPDDGGNLSLVNKALFNNLDDTTDDKKFLYDEDSCNINALTSSTSGLDKKVKSAKEIDYSYDTKVESGGNYSYQLRYQNTMFNKSKNLILFDSLENFKIINSKEGTTTTSGWKGTLQNIDLTQLYKKGIEPVVYISTEEDLDIEAHNDLTDTAIWQVVTENTDLSIAKAISIDMRKDIEGNEFILDAGDSLTAILYMKAPESITEEQEGNPYTYNNIYINNTVIDQLGGTKDYFIHQDYTRLKYYVIADVPIRKVNAKDTSEGIKEITFRLFGTSKYGTEIDKYVKSDAKGNVIFKDIEVGEYILQEYEGNSDWLEDYTEHIVKITLERKVYIDDVLVTKLEPKIITNEPRIHTNILFTKRDIADKNKTLKGVKFKLFGKSDYGNEILMFAISEEDGKVKFNDLEKGKYELKEVATIDGYIPTATTYRVVVDENGNYDIQEQIIRNVPKTETIIENNGTTSTITVQEVEEKYETIYINGSYNLYNEPYHSFYFTKKDSYNYDKLGGAEFKLYGCSNIGNTYDETVTSVEGTGYVTFENLESGTYILKEILPPNTNETTYVVDNAEHIVEVYENGKVTLDSNTIWPLSEINNEPYTWFNDRSKGQITVTKKWLDNLTNDERQEPTIYISTKRPTQSYTKAYFRTANSSYSIIDFVTMEEVTGFRRNIVLSESQVLAKSGVIRIDNDSSNDNTEYKIYAWVENGTLYWWTKADVGVLPANLDYYFNNETSLKDIDWTGMYMSGYWTGTPGSEELSESIVNMRNIFYNCSNIENLNISWFNNTEITEAENMQYAFGENGNIPVGKMSALKYITIGNNFKLFETSVLKPTCWKNQEKDTQYSNTDLIGIISPGTYEYTGTVAKYAVQIYGINQDKDENGNTLGLTFGPATGQNSVNSGVEKEANYNNAYITHTYESNGDGTYKVVIVRHDINSDGTEEITTKYLKNSAGNYVTRTEQEKIKYDVNIHDMTWKQISEITDKTIFTDCMLCGDTKSIQLNLNSTITSGNVQVSMGDGAILFTTIEAYYRKWNPSSNDNSEAINGGKEGVNGITAGGYSISHIRATLIGENDKTDITYAGNINLTTDTSLYSCIEEDLQAVIANKSVKYSTGKNQQGQITTASTVSDPIWLFSMAEMGMSTSDTFGTEGITTTIPMSYQKFNNTDSVSFISSSSDNSRSTYARVGYQDKNNTAFWMLRSSNGSIVNRVFYVQGNGRSTDYYANYFYGIAFGFCIK